MLSNGYSKYFLHLFIALTIVNGCWMSRSFYVDCFLEILHLSSAARMPFQVTAVSLLFVYDIIHIQKYRFNCSAFASSLLSFSHDSSFT